jgi:2-polyprenyl-3-methyl-5-hydroxy-6-metoxy-1,4-benzoquinol methylase
MNESFLHDFLIDPKTGEPLVFDFPSNTFRGSISGNSYPLIGSIPQIIIEDNLSVAKSDLHQKYNSDFNYSDHYQKDADLFDYSELNLPGIIRNEIKRLHESIIKEVSKDFSTVLDVGCGNGWVSKKLIPFGKKIISMDISSTNPVKALREVSHQNHAGLIADVYNIPLKENSIDCIIASEILEHVPDPELFINNLIKLLKINGKLIITVPYNEKIEYYLCVHCNKPTPKFAHLHSFNEENINRYIPQTGVTWSDKTLINNWLSRIRSHVLLKFFPYVIWKFFDNLFNKIFKNPTRLQIIIIKS